MLCKFISYLRLAGAVYIASLLSACTGLVQEKISYQRCEELFTVSDHGQQKIFEKTPGSLDFKLIANFFDFAVRQVVVDCKRKMVVLAYGAREYDRSAAGVAFIDMDTGKREDISIKEGLNTVLSRYKDGLLLDTALLKKMPYEDAVNLGTVGPSWQTVDKNNKKWHVYSDTLYLDLDKRKITQAYPIHLAPMPVIVKNILYGRTADAFIKVNMEVLPLHAEQIFSDPRDVGDSSYYFRPVLAPIVFTPDGDLYTFLNKMSYNMPSLDDRVENKRGRHTRGLQGFDPKGIYKLVEGKLAMVARQPFDDIIEILVVGDYVYGFTTGSDFVKYDTRSKKVSTHKMPVQKPSPDYEIHSVSQTNDALVFIYTKGYEGTGFVVLTDKALSKAGTPYPITIGTMGISTSAHIQSETSMEAIFRARLKDTVVEMVPSPVAR